MKIIELLEAQINTMSELSEFLDELRELKKADLQINNDDVRNGKIYISFELHEKPGGIFLITKDDKKYYKNLKGAAMSIMANNRPKEWNPSWKEVLNIFKYQYLRPNAIKILTDPKDWKILNITHPDYLLPQQTIHED